MKDYENITSLLKKIFTGVVIIIILAVVNTLILVSNNASSKGTENNNDSGEVVEGYDVSKLKEITANEIAENTKGANTVIYIGRDTCGWCVEFTGVLNEAIDKYKLDALYIDVAKIFDFGNNKIIDQNNYDTMINLKAVKSLEGYMEENFLATPMVLIVKDGKIVDAQTGYNEIDGFSSFLEKNGFEQ